ncbi:MULTISPECIES: hypothetical protein [unclassified Haematobacter]|uniref:hypothetical protein n=1 Tax=unclassified Haematobacter TaxID=2640585 RepID=UPI0025C27E61|nr:MULTISPECIES: hypothetical protein [unclassified Haematobacter]
MTEDEMRARIEELETVVRFYASPRAWVGADKEWGVKARSVVGRAGWEVWESNDPTTIRFYEGSTFEGLKPGTQYQFHETYEYPPGWKNKGGSDG